MRRTIASIDTALPGSPRSRSSEIPFDVCICMEVTDKGRVDPEQDQLESPSAGTAFETPGQQCLPNGGTGRITAEGCLLVGVGSNLCGISPTKRIIGTRAGSVTTTPIASSKTASMQTRRKPRDKKTGSEENKQFDPGEKGGEPPPWKAGVPVIFSFLGAVVLCAFVCACLSVVFCLLLSDDHFSAS